MTENSREFREEIARHLGMASYDHLTTSLHDRGIDSDDYFLELLKEAFEDNMRKQDHIKNLLIDLEDNKSTRENQDDYKIVIRKDGKFVSAITPDGGRILNIVKDSVKFEQTPWEKAFARTRVKLSFFIKDASIEVQP
jgi:hypothetical protein